MATGHCESLKILPAEAKDIPVIAKLEKELYPEPWSQKSFEEVLGQETFWFWVAKIAGSIAGYLVCQVVGSEAELHNIAVAKKHQRRGIAKRLLQRLVGALKEKGVVELYLMVRVSNRPAQKLYEKLGFKDQGRRKNYYHSPAEDARIFHLSMSSILSSS